MEPLKSYRAQKFEEEELTNRSKIELQLSTRSDKHAMRNSSLKGNKSMGKNNSTAQIRESMVDHNYSLSGQPTNKMSSSQVINNQSNGYKSSTKVQDWNQPDTTAYEHKPTATFNQTNLSTSQKSNPSDKRDDQAAYKPRGGYDPTGLGATPTPPSKPIVEREPEVFKGPDASRSSPSYGKLTQVKEEQDEHEYRDSYGVDRYNQPDGESEDLNDFDDYDGDDDAGGYLPSSMINKPSSPPITGNKKATGVLDLGDDDWGDL
jgi:hypothetical protein